MSQFNF